MTHLPSEERHAHGHIGKEDGEENLHPLSMSHSLSSLEGYKGDRIRDYYRGYEGGY